MAMPTTTGVDPFLADLSRSPHPGHRALPPVPGKDEDGGSCNRGRRPEQSGTMVAATTEDGAAAGVIAARGHSGGTAAGDGLMNKVAQLMDGVDGARSGKETLLFLVSTVLQLLSLLLDSFPGSAV
ncbi:hypothetical protein OsI_12619 [Oryza sativa Indica Group]|uniref:Uncharacterized protein n=1 Tax=Oryza sativa subsp. indica TaxID=39946 RepID=B8AMJ6_ORYSI|nr:hypothetical protein OsI_12619 [Oryza sativa Indica Group]